MQRIVLAIVFFLILSALGFAQPAQEQKKIIKRTSNEIIGEISALGRDFIAIVYNRDEEKGVEYEMLLPMDTDIKLEHKKSLNELNVGDTVRIQYEDTAFEDSRKEKEMERKAKIISFVSPAVKKPEPPRPPEPGD